MRKIAFLFVLIGTVLLLYPTLSLWIQDMKQQQLLLEVKATPSIDQFEKIAAASSESDQPNGEMPSVSRGSIPLQANTQGEDTLEVPPRNVSPNPVSFTPQSKLLGIIKSDAIDLKLPIVNGVSSQDLDIAPGHMPGTALPGHLGNSVIAGHRSYAYGRMFNRLEELEKGDTINTEIGGHSYEYVIYDKKMVDPTDVSVLSQTKKDKLLTLITCDETGNLRLILHAKLKQ